MARIIKLGRTGQYKAVVDDDDYDWLARHSWNFKVSQWRYGKKIYARRRDARTGRTVLMHREILENRVGIPAPDKSATVDHWDKDSLNNRHSNLRWATESEQSANRKARITAAERAAFASAEVPFLSPRGGSIGFFGHSPMFMFFFCSNVNPSKDRRKSALRSECH